MSLPRSSPPSSLGLDADGDLNGNIEVLGERGGDKLEDCTGKLFPLNYPNECTELPIDCNGHDPDSAEYTADSRLQETAKGFCGSPGSAALEVVLEDGHAEGNVALNEKIQSVSSGPLIVFGSPSSPAAHTSSAFFDFDLLSFDNSMFPERSVLLPLELARILQNQVSQTESIDGFDVKLRIGEPKALLSSAADSREQHQRSEGGDGARPEEGRSNEEGQARKELEVRLREVNGVFEGPCLLSDDSDESD
ncbi:hypothetical protein BDQ17DRAFT_1350876 [Cyathus striatus]|nr:hypothetical protein BDQ17DRAFT_1350876 [Cyathus striatus]